MTITNKNILQCIKESLRYHQLIKNNENYDKIFFPQAVYQIH